MSRRKFLYIITTIVTSSITLYVTIRTLHLNATTSGHLGAIALTPEAAVRDTLQVSANNLQNFQVLINRPWGMRRLMLYSYTVHPPRRPPHEEFGYALTALRVGWSAIPGHLAAEAKPPARITYATADIDGQPLLYGKVLDPSIRKVEVVFDIGTSMTSIPTNDGFLIIQPVGTQIQEFRTYNAAGQILDRYKTPNLSELAFWN